MKLSSIIVSILSGSPGFAQQLSTKKGNNDLPHVTRSDKGTNFIVADDQPNAPKSPSDILQHDSKSVPKTAMTGPARSLSHDEWLQIGQSIDGEGRLDLSGEALSISDNGLIVAIGAVDNDGNSTTADNNQGHVRLYQWNITHWSQLGNDIDGVFAQDQFGHALSLSGDGYTLAVGAPNHDSPQTDIGLVLVFKYDFSISDWTQKGSAILGTGLGDKNGYSVSLSYSGDVLAVGAPDNDLNGIDSGYARVFLWDSSEWVQAGGDIKGEAAADRSGYSVSLSRTGARIAVGAIYNDGPNGKNAGHVRVYEFNGSVWDLLGDDIEGDYYDTHSGYSVSLNGAGDVVAIGSPNSVEGTGLLEVYYFDGAAWNKRTNGTPIHGSEYTDNFGHFVSISDDGNRVAVGAPNTDYRNITTNVERIDAGRVKIFEWENGSWTQLGSDLDGDAAGDIYGYAVAISGDGRHVAIGGPKSSSGSLYAGEVRVFEIHDNDNGNAFASPGGGGDPHFRSFNGGFFSFHGQCDMVLMKSLGFASGRGLDVHIRTTRIDNSQFSYSYISGIAVKLGDAVVEVMTDGGLIVNGEEAELSGERTGVAGILLTSTVKGANKNIIVHDLALSEDISIQIRANTKTGMLFIDVNGMFSDSIGLLGSTEGMFARDGETDMAGFWNALGEEWQVRKTEPKLFLDTHREPQHPAGCLYAGAAKRKAHLRRRLTDDLADEVNIEVATKACAKLSGELRDFCITDIMATGDLELAEDPFYS